MNTLLDEAARSSKPASYSENNLYSDVASVNNEAVPFNENTLFSEAVLFIKTTSFFVANQSFETSLLIDNWCDLI